MDSQLIRNALSDLERQLEEIHEAVRQIEGTSNANASWEDPEGALPHLLNRLYERLLVVLEAADLPETKSRLAQRWYALRKSGGIGKTELLPGDYLESEPLTYLDTVIGGLRLSVAGSNPAEAPVQKAQCAPGAKRIFIGHGGSLVWLALRSFLSERLRLTCDEFNAEPVAGLTTTARLKELLHKASFAFLVMTAEDIHADNSAHARENVIHEAGLFQGRLGFERAIVLLEDGCALFSNIDGLSHIGFPKGNLEAAFEKIRQVLEREHVLDSLAPQAPGPRHS